MGDELKTRLDDLVKAARATNHPPNAVAAHHAKNHLKNAREAVESWLSSNTLAVSAKHVHQCGTCGQYRECYHAGCYFNELADCDPKTGCRTPPHKFLKVRVQP